MSVVMPAGEARTIQTAYHIAIMRAITDIREHKTKELIGSEFSHIPHMEEEDDPMLNHFKYAKRKPAEAAKYMDNSRNLLTLFFQLNRHLSGAIDTVLEEFTEPKEETKGKEPMEGEVHTPVYSAGDFISIDHPEQQTTPITPRYFPSSSHGGYEGGGMRRKLSVKRLLKRKLHRTRGICRERRVRRVKHSASSVRPRQKEEADEAARNQFPPPPPMTQQNFLQYMQMLEERQRVTMEQQNKFFQELLQQNRVERPENQGVTLSDFQNTKPISFAYAPEPMDAEDWLMDTERKLNTVGCNDLEKVRYATHLLCGPAASWWDNIVAVYPAEKVFTWEEFKRKFRESNVPESIVELKRREFESLEQKDKAILTYVREFSKLSRYAVEEVNTEDKKKKRFLRGLSPQFKVQLR
ncbi:hypothetical protein QYE76_015157 [Lolium multiflorum]|uniref:Retrotransposon gag domain-containing protein n=1 Tax=Lolium multiflorum TaxID=4521 RepID=A0AAD8U6B3_LOLMU|nr:hypothetical protein QYE76_015157 [Lolium multiflorum]